MNYDIPVWEVSGSGPGYQSGYRSGHVWSLYTSALKENIQSEGKLQKKCFFYRLVSMKAILLTACYNTLHGDSNFQFTIV